jgi:hypothetical protein
MRLAAIDLYQIRVKSGLRLLGAVGLPGKWNMIDRQLHSSKLVARGKPDVSFGVHRCCCVCFSLASPLHVG